MEKEIILKLHELERKRDILNEHLDKIQTPQYNEGSVIHRFYLNEGFNTGDWFSEQLELIPQFLPKDILAQYISNATKRLNEIEREIEEL